MDVAKPSRHKHWTSLSALTAQTWKLAGGRWRASEACSGGASCLQPAPQARVAWSVGEFCQLPRLHAIKLLDTGHLASASGAPTGIKGMLHPARAVVLAQAASGRHVSGRHHSADHPPAHWHSPITAYACKSAEQSR